MAVWAALPHVSLLNSMAAEGILGFGNGMRYRYGLFRQKIEGGRQVEGHRRWLDKGYPWETRHDESSVIVRFGGEVVRHEDESGRTSGLAKRAERW